MSKHTGDGLMEKLKALLAEREEVAFAYLFGSRALGYGRPESDVDLAVFFTEEAPALTEIELAESLSLSLGLEVQVIPLSEPIPDKFKHNILRTGVLVKDGPGRKEWERAERARASQESGKMQDFREDYLEYLLGSMREKRELLIRNMSLLDELDIEALQRGELRAVRDFLGSFMMIFEPLETLIRRLLNYSRQALSIEKLPETKGKQLEFIGQILGLEEQTVEILTWMSRLRNLIAHAYWDLEGKPMSRERLEGVKRALEDFCQKFGDFLKSQKGGEREVP